MRKGDDPSPLVDPGYVLKCITPGCDKRGVPISVGKAVPLTEVLCLKCGKGMPVFAKGGDNGRLGK
jgi:hypothetical protein